MNAVSKNLKQWWLPSLILLVAILLISLLLPNLIYPRDLQQNSQQPAFAPVTSTPTLPPTLTLNIINTPTVMNVSLETPFTPTPPGVTGQNCTYTMYYWRSNPNAWLAENILIGRFSYSKSEAIEILSTENQDITTDLLKQFFTTLLNLLKGTDTSSVDSTLVEASDWLGKHALGFEVSQADRQTGAALAQTLEDFNTGVTGPGPCADEPPTPTPFPTDTPTPTETPIPTRIATRRPATPTPESRETEEREDPTDEPTTGPTEAPTEPQPTEPQPTEPEPTERPTEPPPPPTDVPEPTDRPTPTPVPEPADTSIDLP